MQNSWLPIRKISGDLKSRLSCRESICIVSQVCVSFSLAIVMASCGGGGHPARHLTSLTVQPSDAEAVAPEGTTPFTAIGTFDQAPITQSVMVAQWTSSDSSIATIDANTGMATCLASGEPITITATAAKVAGSVQGSGILTCLPSRPSGQGRCVVQADSTMSGYCVGVRGLLCRQAYDPPPGPPGQPPTPVEGEQCAQTTIIVDVSRSCIP
jgi:hypothetical protein